MTDLELYAHFFRHIYYMSEDICYVRKENYQTFVEKLPFKSSTPEFSVRIGRDGNISFNINDIRSFFKDFPEFKRVFKQELDFYNRTAS